MLALAARSDNSNPRPRLEAEDERGALPFWRVALEGLGHREEVVADGSFLCRGGQRAKLPGTTVPPLAFVEWSLGVHTPKTGPLFRPFRAFYAKTVADFASFCTPCYVEQV